VTTPYCSSFFDEIREGSRQSARVVVPLILELCRPNEIRRVADVGCGTGGWLHVFAENGASVAGFDGDYVDLEKLEISADCFTIIDLNRPEPLGETYDLVTCLEVGEHLPDEVSVDLVKTLTDAAPVVVFSAAVPGQGGTHHINEQWPVYWAEHFAARGYVGIDCLRHKLLGNPEVEWWYQQNLVIYVNEKKLDLYPTLAAHHTFCEGRVPAIAHPLLFERWKVAHDIAEFVGNQAHFVLLDQCTLPRHLFRSDQPIEYPATDGVYWGTPSDSTPLIQQIEQFRQEGAYMLVVANPAFWWLDFYGKFAEYLIQHSTLVHEDHSFKAFDLR
jgi:SAM-dependent methyltransferase